MQDVGYGPTASVLLNGEYAGQFGIVKVDELTSISVNIACLLQHFIIILFVESFARLVLTCKIVLRCHIDQYGAVEPRALFIRS